MRMWGGGGGGYMDEWKEKKGEGGNKEEDKFYCECWYPKLGRHASVLGPAVPNYCLGR